MTRLELYINGVKAVLGGVRTLGLSLQREFTDLKNPEKRSADFSFTISLPKCPVNNKIFNSGNEAHQIDKFNRLSDFNAELFADGRPIVNGLFRLRDVDGDYNGNLYGGQISWATLLESITLQDLKNGDGSTWAANFNLANLPASMQTYQIKTAREADIIFPLIAYTPFPKLSTSSLPALIPKFEIVLDSIVTQNDFQYFRLPPSVYYVNIIKKCFEAIGWEVSSDLFQDESFLRLIVPYVNDVLYKFNLHQLHGIDATGLEASLVNPPPPPYNFIAENLEGNLIFGEDESSGNYHLNLTDIIAKNSDDNTYNTFGNGDYIVNFTQQYNFKFDLKGFYMLKDLANNATPRDYRRVALVAINENLTAPELTEAKASINAYLREDAQSVNSDNVLFFADFFTGYSNKEGTTFSQLLTYAADLPSAIGSDKAIQTDASLIPGQDIIIESPPMQIERGEKINFYLLTYSRDYRNYTLAPAPPPDGLWITGFKYTSLQVEMNNQFEDVINIAENLPDVNCKDFISGFIALTNSYFITDAERKTVNFFTFPKLHKNPEQGYKWEGGSIEEAKFVPYSSPRILKLNYSIDDNDLLVAGTNYGNLTQVFNNVYSTGEKEISVLFSSTLFRDVIYSRSPAATSFKVPNIMSGEQFDQITTEVIYKGGYVPRLLQVTGKLDGGAFVDTINVDGEETDIILCTFNGEAPVNSQQLIDKINLKFDDSPGELPSLYEKYYRQFFEITERGHIIELQGGMNPKDWENMTFDRFVLFDSEQFYLISINNFNPITPGSAVVQLLKRI